MDDYAGRVLADRYRLPLPPSEEYELVETRAFDTYSGQEVLVRQLPLPEVVDAEVLDSDGAAAGRTAGSPGSPGASRGASGRTTRRPADPAVRRAVEAAQAAAQIPDHPRLDQVFDVFAEAGSLWIVSELIAARPLAALLAERPLNPYRAAEIGSDVLTALRALHAHGWTHRNITARTVLVCDDGRVVLTGLAAGVAEEALCGYAPVPPPDDEDGPSPPYEPSPSAHPEPSPPAPPAPASPPRVPEQAFRTAPDEPPALRTQAVRSGAIAAYRAGARAAARADEAGAAAALPPGGTLPPGYEPDRSRLPVAGAHDTLYGDEDDDHVGDSHDGFDDGFHEDDHGGEAPRALLTGTWHDGPGQGSGHVPAGGGGAAGGPGGAARRPDPTFPAALSADTRRHTRVPRPASERTPDATPRTAGHWDEAVAGSRPPAAYRGPSTPLAAERARQARIAVVGAVTERWAPEQAGPVHDTWQLAPPIGPATDLWALGALLYRAVQGHAPYPEESAAELVQMVCAEPPAFAEECGPLRPVVESLLRQDPTERPDFEELRGWLRSLIRSAPEPEAGLAVVPMPSVDETRLPVVRRRGELVRKRRAGSPGRAHGRPRHRRERAGPARPARTGSGSPRALGRLLLLVILLALAAAIAYAMLFLPESEPQGGASAPRRSAQPTSGNPPTSGDPSGTAPTPTTPAPSPNTVTPTPPVVAAGYTVRDDPEGFRIAVDKSWRRSPINDVGQVRYAGGDYTLIVVPGRDTVRANGSDPLEYQRGKERELQPWRDSSWASVTGMRRIDVGRQAMAEGQFTWQDSNGREVYVRNLALIIGDRYHVIQVIGPDDRRDKVTEIYQQAVTAYRATR
ncbi:protein kinase [Streptomyces sp. NPDC006368]|uniref:protein kinase n=1 Tax=Streptomyces sp. NPDC006368 TaxID=3156760 RepID=UPI0033AC5E49